LIKASNSSNFGGPTQGGLSVAFILQHMSPLMADIVAKVEKYPRAANTPFKNDFYNKIDP
jgi:hypothetical protein